MALLLCTAFLKFSKKSYSDSEITIFFMNIEKIPPQDSQTSVVVMAIGQLWETQVLVLTLALSHKTSKWAKNQVTW